MLHAFFAYGVIFEPHLQNTVICLKDGLPSGVIVRDFEGVKLVDSRWSDADLKELNDRARQSVRYSFTQGWNRVRYCLLINNLSEAVSFLADDNPQTEQQLWLIIREVISAYLNSTENALAREHLTALLNGEAIPSKTNLLVRIKKHPDRQAGYVYLNSPFAIAKH
ncbi:ferric iron reductase [Aliamphritea spongicola]|nr:ferric iron reductase [Aliamphritea spongicola]